MARTIENILSDSYGVGVVAADWTTVTWAVRVLEAESGSKEAAKQMKRVNRVRERHGKYTSIPDYGTSLFAAYFGK
jgi:hypothetical protein